MSDDGLFQEPSDDGSRTVRQIALHVGIAEEEALSLVRGLGYREVELDAPRLNARTAEMAMYMLDLRRRAYARLEVGDLAPIDSIETVRDRHNAWALANYGIQLYLGHNREGLAFFLYLKLIGTAVPAGMLTDLDGYPLVVGLMRPFTPREENTPFMPTEATDRPPPGSAD